MNHTLDCKKQILTHLIKDFRLEGELPDIGLLKSCLDQMNPNELAQSIYYLECFSSGKSNRKIQKNMQEV